MKRYGAEGAESMLAFFDQVLTDCVAMEIEEVVVGMPHRGRLNLLTDLFHFPRSLFFHKVQCVEVLCLSVGEQSASAIAVMMLSL